MRAAVHAETKDLIWQLNQHSAKCNCGMCAGARAELIKRGVSVKKPLTMAQKQALVRAAIAANPEIPFEAE